MGLISGLEIFPGGAHGNLLQYSCLENPMDRGAWWATVHRITETYISEVTELTWAHSPQLQGRFFPIYLRPVFGIMQDRTRDIFKLVSYFFKHSKRVFFFILWQIMLIHQNLIRYFFVSCFLDSLSWCLVSLYISYLWLVIVCSKLVEGIIWGL